MQFVIMFALDRDLNKTPRLMNSFEVERKVVDQDSTPCSQLRSIGVSETGVDSCR